MAALSIAKDNLDYTAIDSVKTDQGTLSAWHSMRSNDSCWDSFLAQSCCGHFYQTSMWAGVRKLDGWHPQIVLITRDGAVTGGFQVLTRSKPYIGNIGLVLKGPVVNSNDAAAIEFAIRTLKDFARANRIRALVVQPSDRDEDMPDLLLKSGFSPSHLEHAIKNNTVVIDLRGDEDSIFKAIKRTKRQNINASMRSGMIVREGGKENLGTFFSFMLETCKRQGVSPSPSSLEFLNRMWDIFSPTGSVRLFLSEYKGEIVSCLIVLPFGDTAYLWKFGWSGKYPKLFPNIIIYWEIFKWARANGHNFADLGAISKELAEVVWNAQSITDEQAKTYSYYKLSFGGEVVRLTEGFVFFRNPVLRRAFSFLMPHVKDNPFLKKKMLFPDL